MCNPTALIERENYQDLLGDLFEWTLCLLIQPFLGSLSSTRIFITQIKGEKQGILFNRIETNDNKLNNLYCIHQYHLPGIQRNS